MVIQLWNNLKTYWFSQIHSRKDENKIDKLNMNFRSQHCVYRFMVDSWNENYKIHQNIQQPKQWKITGLINKNRRIYFEENDKIFENQHAMVMSTFWGHTEWTQKLNFINQCFLCKEISKKRRRRQFQSFCRYPIFSPTKCCTEHVTIVLSISFRKGAKVLC